MKVAAILTIDAGGGGGFNQAMNAVRQMATLAQGQFDFVTYTTLQENLAPLARLGIEARFVASGLTDKFIAACAVNEVGRKLQDRLRLVSRIEEAMLRDSVDLVYFVAPSSLCLSLQKLPYIMTVWDVCHRDSPEFPEVRQFNEFHATDWLYRNGLAGAFLVIADSDALADRIAGRYGISRDRLLTMPFAPAPLAARQYSSSMQDVLGKYQLEEGYFFYPAQFWAHKNHIRIVQALSALKNAGDERVVVFAGGDQGNLPHVRGAIAELGVGNLVKVLGFVPHEDLRGLYEGCAAVVMPTYFGPTNLPPLEAWSIGKPLIYSSTCARHADGAALLVDPDDASALAAAMKQVTRSEVATDLIGRGSLRLAEIDSQRAVAEDALKASIARFARRRECWG
jgi:glycosyltransferase involved in cell wall biosynthesis